MFYPKLTDMLTPVPPRKWTKPEDYSSLARFNLRKKRPRFVGISKHLDRRGGLRRGFIALLGGK